MSIQTQTSLAKQVVQSIRLQPAKTKSWIEFLALKSFDLLEPEIARDAVIRLLKLGLVPSNKSVISKRLNTKIAGIQLANPLGLAAGFDKDAKVIGALRKMGFGFIEVGAVTPKPQKGNDKPRLFRLDVDRAVINRFGFNSEGAEKVKIRLSKNTKGFVLGLNIGANKDSKDKIADYVDIIYTCSEYVDFVSLNVSSPNTNGLSSLQNRSELQKLLRATKAARNSLPNRPKLFLKIAPDLSLKALHQVAETALEEEIDAIIATNTLAIQDGTRLNGGQPLQLTDRYQTEKGGLSGRPIFNLSTRVLGEIYYVTKGKIPLIGVGGIENVETAFNKIQAGASALQLYSGLVYQGFSIIPEILTGLDDQLKKHGFTSVQEAVGTDNANWRL